MAEDEKQAPREQRVLLVLGILAFIVAVALIILALSSFNASVAAPNKNKTAGHGMFRASQP